MSSAIIAADFGGEETIKQLACRSRRLCRWVDDKAAAAYWPGPAQTDGPERATCEASRPSTTSSTL